jgi:8-oxo-dGTP pyrophosphatase MutT (NUDIX family)
MICVRGKSVTKSRAIYFQTFNVGFHAIKLYVLLPTMNESISSHPWIENLRQALLESLPGAEAHRRMIPSNRQINLEAPTDARVSSVMILLYENDAEWNTVLIRRSKDGQVHSGQISFPGGKKENSDPDLIYTAKRECEEEIGIPNHHIEILGTLSDVYIPPSNFLVTPVVGHLTTTPSFRASEREVSEIIRLPLNLLFHPSVKSTHTVNPSYNPSASFETPVYALADDLIVWGATAMMIAELEVIIDQFKQTPDS